MAWCRSGKAARESRGERGTRPSRTLRRSTAWSSTEARRCGCEALAWELLPRRRQKGRSSGLSWRCASTAQLAHSGGATHGEIPRLRARLAQALSCRFFSRRKSIKGASRKMSDSDRVVDYAGGRRTAAWSDALRTALYPLLG